MCVGYQDSSLENSCKTDNLIHLHFLIVLNANNIKYNCIQFKNKDVMLVSYSSVVALTDQNNGTQEHLQ